MASVRPIPALWTTPQVRAFRDGSPAFGVALAAPFLTLWIALFALPLAWAAWESRQVPGGALARFTVHLWPGVPVAGGVLDAGFGIVAITAVAMTLGVCAGVPAAYGAARHRFAGARGVAVAALLPLAVPTPVLAVVLSAALRLRGFQWPAWIAAAALANVALVVWCTRAALRHAALRPLEDAAAACGLTPAARFVEIALPTLAPPLGAALVATAALTASELALATALGHAWATAFAEAARALQLAGPSAVPPAGVPAAAAVRGSAAFALHAPPVWTVGLALATPAALRLLCVAAWARQARRAPAATPWGIV